MKQKSTRSALLVLALTLGLGWFFSTRIPIGGQWFLRSEAVLDLQAIPLSAEDYEAVRRELPDTEILWNPPFQGRFLPADTREITVTNLSDEDVEALDYFEALTTLDGRECTDYTQLLELTLRRPEVKVCYRIGAFDQDTVSAKVPDADPEEVRLMLTYLPRLETVTLTGKLPPVEAIQALKDQYPDHQITYEASFFGRTLSPGVTGLDLTGETVSREELFKALPYLPSLSTVTLFDTGLEAAEILPLQEAFPQVTFYFDLTLGGSTLRNQGEEIDISGIQTTPEEVEALLPYLPEVKKIIMVDCGISNEEMDALNRRHEDIQFVWSVSLGGRTRVRTDITGFINYRLGVKTFHEGQLDNLRYCTELVALDLGHQDIRTCGFVANLPKLKYLILADTHIYDLSPLAGLTELVYLEIFMTRVQDYSPLLNLTNLKDLNLNWTYGDYTIIGQMPWLERVWWGGKWHNKDVRAYLAEHCPNTLFQYDNGDSTGSGWRKGYLYFEMRDALGMYYME